MKIVWTIMIASLLISLWSACNQKKNENEQSKVKKNKQVTAADILGNPKYQAISYGGYRQKTRDEQPTVKQLKEDMKILAAMGIKILRTYNVQLPHAPNLLKAIHELKQADPTFEMYVMLGAWIDCKNAWTDQTPDHTVESEQNVGEIERAVALANQYPDIVKVLAVGNEAMVRWAESYYVQPKVILKWVNHLQGLKKTGKLPKELWITCSDDFASWGGGDKSYHTPTLAKLIKAVDYVSMHTYPFHNTHYNPAFWKDHGGQFNSIEEVDAAMARALVFAQKQYQAVSDHVKSLGLNKPIHIGETGWATVSTDLYGDSGTNAADEYKQGLYYQLMRDWTNTAGISCFYFEAFDEQWKDAGNENGSENHFGLFTLDAKAKYPLWDMVSEGAFNGLTRDGHVIKKTYDGNQDALFQEVMASMSNLDTVEEE